MPRYYYLNRPPGIGCQPDGFTERERWSPKREIPGTERTAHGWVEYLEKLDPYQIWKWEFYPADPVELEAYWDWREEEQR